MFVRTVQPADLEVLHVDLEIPPVVIPPVVVPPVDLVVPPVEPVVNPVEPPVEAVVPPVEPPVEAVVPPVEPPVEAVVPPIEPPVEPGVPPVEAVVPAVDPDLVENIVMYPNNDDIDRIKKSIFVPGPSWHWEQEFFIHHLFTFYRYTNESGGYLIGSGYCHDSNYNTINKYNKNCRYSHRTNNGLMIISHDLKLLQDINFMKAYGIVMKAPVESFLNNTYGEMYKIVRSHKRKFNLEAMLGVNVCKLLDAIFIDDLKGLDTFDKVDLFSFIHSIYRPHVNNIIMNLATKMTQHPLVWAFIITNVACDFLTRYDLTYNSANLTDDEHRHLRNNLLTDKNSYTFNKNPYRNWFGYITIDLLIKDQSAYIFSSSDLANSGQKTFTCIQCQDLIELDPDNMDKEVALCGIGGTDCDCLIHLDCAALLATNYINSGGVDCLDTQCLGCRREMTIEFYKTLMLLLEYNEFKKDYGVSLYFEIYDKISVLRQKGDGLLHDVYSMVNRLSKSNLLKFVNYVKQIDKILGVGKLSFMDKVNAFNKKVYDKIGLDKQPRTQVCKNNGCNLKFLLDPNSEVWYKCIRCNSEGLYVGNIKKELDKKNTEGLKLLLRENPKDFCSCSFCHKIMERITGCNTMKCYFCKNTFSWNRLLTDNDLVSTHY